MAKTSTITLAGARLSLWQAGYSNDGRMQYRYTITLPDGSRHKGNDLASGCGNDKGARVMMGTLLSFLGACAESYDYRTRQGIALDDTNRDDNLRLFPLPVAEWASNNNDEITMKQYEIEEGKEV